MLTREFSLRVSIIRFPLIVGVVFIHSYDIIPIAGEQAATPGYVFLECFRNLISQGLGRTAVPLFFLISGYLFFVGFSSPKQSYLSKLRSRARRLLVPYVFWNSATLALLPLAQALPQTGSYFSGNKSGKGRFVAWRLLAEQMGGDYADVKDFARYARQAMRKVLALYPTLKLGSMRGGVRVEPAGERFLLRAK